MHTLGMLTGEHHKEREDLITGLRKVVDKRLGRTQAA
jgi:hypothetical protein